MSDKTSSKEMKKTYRDVMTPTVTRIDESHIRIIFSVGEYEMACLYFENAKKVWTNKPLSMNGWRCVDAKITDKIIYINGLVEPKDLVGWGQELILGPKNGIHNGKDNISNKNSL